ncbi:MAG: hypothetical protein AAGH79_09630 [Bacteroidota bacterium]
MKNGITGILIGLFLPCLLSAQYEYEVTTLLPTGENLIDDGLSIAPDGTVYGSHWGVWPSVTGTHILRYNPDGTYENFVTGVNRPNGMSYHNGQLYFANSGTGELMVADANGETTSLQTVPGGLSNAVGKPGSDTLMLITWGSTILRGWSPDDGLFNFGQSTLLNGAAGGAFAENGDFFIANYDDGNIIRYADGEFSLHASLGGGIGFLTYSDGALLATNHIDNKIYQVSIADGSAEVIAGSGTAAVVDGIGAAAAFDTPNGIVATASGDTIYVSDFGPKTLRMIVRRMPSSLVSVDEEKNTVTAFPLPASDHLHLRSEAWPDLQQAVLMDAQGRTMKIFESWNWASDSLDLQDVPAGAYWLQLRNPDGATLQTIAVPIQR